MITSLNEPIAKPTYLDPSGFACCQRCPAKYYLSRILGLSPIAPNQLAMIAPDFGTCIHRALPYCYSNPDRAIEEFKLAWSAYPYEGSTDKRALARNITRASSMLRNFHNARRANPVYKILEFPGIKYTGSDVISANEVPFLVDIGSSLPLAGRIDCPVELLSTHITLALDYKGHPLTTQLPTPSGMIYMKDVKVGTVLLSPSGKTSVVGIHPLGEEQVFEVTLMDGSTVETTADHIWSLFDCATGKIVNKKTKEMVSWTDKQHRRYKLPNIKEAEFDFRYVPIEPYVLGVLLGDGYLSEDYGVRVTTADNDILDYVAKYYPVGTLVEDKRSTACSFSILHVSHIADYLRDLKLMGAKSHTKFIPPEYLFNCKDIRLLLLQGLMDTDGGLNAHGSPVFVTTSAQLAIDVKFLVASLGGVSKIRVERSSLNGKDYGLKYVQNIRFNENLGKVFRLSRKKELVRTKSKESTFRRIESVMVTRRAECRCITTDDKDSLYLVDDFIPTHNTASEISARLFNCFTLSPQAIAYTLALSTLTNKDVFGFAVEALRVSPVNDQVEIGIISVSDQNIKDFVRQFSDCVELILSCLHGDKYWPQNFAGCSPYASYGTPGYLCEYQLLCNAPNWQDAFPLYRRTEPFSPFKVKTAENNDIA